ncbi:MAG: FxsA family protein [Paracoccaceae bacterium]|nr:FxsA family protein [Paracoccaceae bacterium]
MWLFIAFLIVPIIEITLFIQVYSLVGLLPTLAGVVLTAFIGARLVRSQGLATVGRVQNSFNELNDPTEPLAHGAMILFAGALLFTPGYFTDAIGFSLMVPGVRATVFNFLKSRVNVTTAQSPGFKPHGPADSDVIDAEFVEVPNPDDHRPSGWTKD